MLQPFERARTTAALTSTAPSMAVGSDPLTYDEAIRWEDCRNCGREAGIWKDGWEGVSEYEGDSQGWVTTAGAG